MRSKDSKNNNKTDDENSGGPSSLPFEVDGGTAAMQSPQSSSRGRVKEEHIQPRKKRIEAIISSEKLDRVLTAIGSLKLAATYYDSKGKGKGQKYTISYGRGVGSSKMAYSDRKTIVTIVDEHRVEDVITAIRSAASADSSSSSAGVIVISSVDDILQI
jgi:nitrogen regulatory protein P-II 1